MVRPQTYLTINLPNRDQVGINLGSIQGRFGVDSGSIRGRFGFDSVLNGRTAGRPNGRTAERLNGRTVERPKIRYVKGVTVGSETRFSAVFID